MRSASLENKHNTLIHHIKEKGEIFPKKHGNWHKLNLFKDYFLELDSWNGKINLRRGDGSYNEWRGFNGYIINFLGGNFGGFYKPDDENALDWILFDVLKVNYIIKRYI